MEEEKVKKKKKKKSKDKKKKKDGGPKKPSEKKILKKKLRELNKELVDVSSDLEQHQSILSTWKDRVDAETKQRDACVSHLRRKLEEVTQDCVRAQEELGGVKRRHQEADLKIAEVKKRLEAEREAERSVFNQQKTELEEKLSMLEERRLKRNYQLSRIQKLEESLVDKLSDELHEDREEDRQHVENLLRKRDEFMKLLDGLVSDHEDMVQAQLPVFAREQCKDNVKYRTRCQDAAESLLKVQDKHRLLQSQVQGPLQTEIETQESADQVLKTRATQTINRLDEVLKGVDRHQPVEKQHLQVMRDEISTMTTMMESINDEIEEVQEVMRDQDNYMKSLEAILAKIRDENGIRVSKILSASRVLKGRANEVNEAQKTMDVELLQQIKLILEDDCGVYNSMRKMCN